MKALDQDSFNLNQLQLFALTSLPGISVHGRRIELVIMGKWESAMYC